MIKIFNHYFHKRTFLQIVFDFGLVIATVLASALPQLSEAGAVISVVVFISLMLACGIVVINAGLGFYQRINRWTLGQTRLRAMLSLCLSLALAYGVFRLAPIRLNDEKVFLLALVAGVVVMLLHRTYVMLASPQALIRQRVLVYGSGERAWLVGKSLENSDPNVDLVGYYAGPNEAACEVSGGGASIS